MPRLAFLHLLTVAVCQGDPVMSGQRALDGFVSTRGMAMSQEHKATAVVIDVHPSTLRVASEIMQAEFELLAASSNSEAACDIVAMFHPDIAVLDIATPAKDGFEIARQMRQRHLPTQIIFLTAEEDNDCASAARDMGLAMS